MNKLLLTIRSKRDYHNINKLLIKYIDTQDDNIIDKIIATVISTTAKYKAYSLKGINYLYNTLELIISTLTSKFKALATKLQIQFTNFIRNSILTMVIITICLLIGANNNVQATNTNSIKSIETTATGMLVNYNDNTGYYIDFNEVDNNVVDFINSKQNKLNTSDKITVTNIIYESTEDFYLESNEIALILDNNDYIIINTETNEGYYNNENDIDISTLSINNYGINIE